MVRVLESQICTKTEVGSAHAGWSLGTFRKTGIALLLVVVVLYAFLPWAIPTEAVLVLSVQRVHQSPIVDLKGTHVQPVYFVWHLQNRTIPHENQDAIWSLVGYPWEESPYSSTEPPRHLFQC